MAKSASALQITKVAKYFCPLLKCEISEAYCYEINSVAFGLCKPSLIGDIVGRKEAETVCGSCKNRAM